MSDSIASALLRRLQENGVQVWHNRGHLYCGPLKKVTDDDKAAMAFYKPDIIARLKREPITPFASWDLCAPVAKEEGSYEGRLSRKPWDYEVAVVLPTLGASDLLRAAIACWRNQTVSPYLIVVDTGGRFDDLDDDGYSLRAADLELHSIACHGWRHSSSPVGAALDLAFAVMQQNKALLTHVDVFPKHDHVIEDVLARVTPSSPVVGYQMSKRVGTAEWRKCVSHTLTAVDMQVMRRIGASWNLLSVLEQDGELDQRFLGWPDTETRFNRCIRAAGIIPEFLGPEPNGEFFESDLVIHWRSLPTIRHYHPEEVEKRYPDMESWLWATRTLGRAASVIGLQTSGFRELEPELAADEGGEPRTEGQPHDVGQQQAADQGKAGDEQRTGG